MNLNIIETLKNERIAINKKCLPLNLLMAQKRADVAKLESDIAAADAALDNAIKSAAHAEGVFLLSGDASSAELADAKQARKAAEKGYALTQASAVGVRGLKAELDGLSEAGRALGLRLGEIATEEASAEERYLRDIVNDLGADYADACKTVGTKFAALLAAQQMLAAGNMNPNLTGGSTAMLLLPSFNTPSARSQAGVLMDYDRARLEQPQQFQVIRDRILADGVQINGL